MKTAARLDSLKGSSIMDIAAKAQELKTKGHDVVSLAAGEPDQPTPEVIQQAVTRAMAEGITRYAPAQGFLGLREAVAELVKRDNHLDVSPEEIIITSGAKHAIYLALQALLDPGDVVIVPTPGWVSYGPMIELCGGTLMPLPLLEEDGFRPNAERLKGISVPARARGIILNSPNNPTGVVFSRSDLMALVSWALQRGLWIMSDEIYEKILFDGAEHTSVASLGPEVKANTITISGFSKSYCMTGWRLGWAIADKSLIQKMTALQSQSNSHVTSFVQWAGITAAKLPAKYIQDLVKEFDTRRQYCMQRLDRLSEYVNYVRPSGAFYIFANLSPWLSARKMTDSEFCKELLNKYYVALVPGSSFGQDKSIRISYANSMKNLEKAFDRIEKLLRS